MPTMMQTVMGSGQEKIVHLLQATMTLHAAPTCTAVAEATMDSVSKMECATTARVHVRRSQRVSTFALVTPRTMQTVMDCAPTTIHVHTTPTTPLTAWGTVSSSAHRDITTVKALAILARPGLFNQTTRWLRRHAPTTRRPLVQQGIVSMRERHRPIQVVPSAAPVITSLSTTPLLLRALLHRLLLVAPVSSSSLHH